MERDYQENQRTEEREPAKENMEQKGEKSFESPKEKSEFPDGPSGFRSQDFIEREAEFGEERIEPAGFQEADFLTKEQKEINDFQLDEIKWQNASIEEKRTLLNQYHQSLYEKLGIEEERKELKFYSNIHLDTYDSEYHPGQGVTKINVLQFHDFDRVISSLSRETYKTYMHQEMNKANRHESCHGKTEEWTSSFFQERDGIFQGYRPKAFHEDAEAFAKDQVEQLNEKKSSDLSYNGELDGKNGFTEVNQKNQQLEQLEQNYENMISTNIRKLELEYKDWNQCTSSERKQLMRSAYNDVSKNELEMAPTLVFEAPNNGDIIKGNQIILSEYQKETNRLYIHPSVIELQDSQIGRECLAHGLALRKMVEINMENDNSILDVEIKKVEEPFEVLSKEEQWWSSSTSSSSTSRWDKIFEAQEKQLEAARSHVDEFEWDFKKEHEREEALRQVGQYISMEELNLKDPPSIEYFEELPIDGKISRGGYEEESNTVYINRFIFNDVQRAVTTLGHELRHAKQHEMKEDWDRTQRFKMFRSDIDNRVMQSVVNPNLEPVRDWSYNLGKTIFGKPRYIQPTEEKFEQYKNQPVEQDANDYGERIRKLFFNN